MPWRPARFNKNAMSRGEERRGEVRGWSGVELVGGRCAVEVRMHSSSAPCNQSEIVLTAL